MAKNTEKRRKPEKNSIKTPKKKYEIPVENDNENETEILSTNEDNDETDTNDAGSDDLHGSTPLFEAPHTPEQAVGLESDNMDILYDIKNELQKQGVDLKGTVKYVICKKDDKGRYPLIKSFMGEMPDLDYIGETYGSGDYLVKVITSEGYKLSKTFPISSDAYPEHPAKQSTIPQPQNQNSPIIMNTPQSNNGLEVMLKSVMEQNNTLLTAIITRENSSKKDDMTMLQMVKMVKELTPPPPQMPVEMILGMANNMFKAGIDLKQNIEDNEKDSDVGDVLLDAVKTLVGKLPDIMTGVKATNALLESSTNNQQKPAPNAPQSSENKQVNINDKQKQLLLLLKDYFDDVILAHESELYTNPYYFAEKVYKLKKYQPVQVLVKQLDVNTMINILSTYGLAENFKDIEFKDYVLQIIDIIKDFDIITLDDEGNIIKSVRPVTPAQGSEIKPETIVQGDNNDNDTGEHTGNNSGNTPTGQSNEV